ncbi:MAG: permease [Alphaproteobacteria bacterium]
MSEASSRSPARSGTALSSYIIIGLLVLTGGGLLWWRDGPAGLVGTLDRDGAILLDLLPRLAAAMVIAGLVQVMVPRELVSRWLGARSGWPGLFISTIVGGLMPGGPLTSFPIVLVLSRAGADMGVLVCFVTSWALLGLNRILVWELPFLGPELVIIRVLVSLPLPILAGLTARHLVPRLWARPALSTDQGNPPDKI